MQRHRISLKRGFDPILSALPLGELGIAALDELPGAIDLLVEQETMFSEDISFVWIGCGVPVISDVHLSHFRLQRRD